MRNTLESKEGWALGAYQSHLFRSLSPWLWCHSSTAILPWSWHESLLGLCLSLAWACLPFLLCPLPADDWIVDLSYAWCLSSSLPLWLLMQLYAGKHRVLNCGFSLFFPDNIVSCTNSCQEWTYRVYLESSGMNGSKKSMSSISIVTQCHFSFWFGREISEYICPSYLFSFSSPL